MLPPSPGPDGTESRSERAKRGETCKKVSPLFWMNTLPPTFLDSLAAFPVFRLLRLPGFPASRLPWSPHFCPLGTSVLSAPLSFLFLGFSVFPAPWAPRLLGLSPGSYFSAAGFSVAFFCAFSASSWARDFDLVTSHTPTKTHSAANPLVGPNVSSPMATVKSTATTGCT